MIVGANFRGWLEGCVALAFVAAPLCAAEPSEVTVDSPGGARVRVEALDPGIVRLWWKPTGDFTRKTSLAMVAAPTTRVPLTVARSATVTKIDAGLLDVMIDPHTLAFAVEQAGKLLIPATTITPAANGSAWTLAQPLREGERLLGLGQDNHNNGRLDRRGVVRELWAGQQINSGNVTAQYPVPLLIGLLADGRAYGVFFDNAHRLRFDLGAKKSDELRLDTDGGEIDLYVLAGPKIADVIERYTRLTGRPSLPPLWVLGYWQSKCFYYSWAGLDEAYDQLHARGFPVDVMVIDSDWPQVTNNYQWIDHWQVKGGTPADKIADYAKRGVKIVLSEAGPMIKQESPTFKSGWDEGVFATDGKGNPVECGYYGGKLLDFTSPKLNDWLWPQVRARQRDGIAGWWLDLTEPEGEPPQTHYFGGRPANVHNEFSLLCTLSFEGAQLAESPDVRPWILTRSASAGSQSHHAAVWTGDIFSDYATLRAHPAEMLNSGLSGLVWWTSDTGGFLNGFYKNDQMGAHAKLYERWMQFSAFGPITRAHKAGVPEPYQFGPEVEKSCLHYLKLRYRLLPYIYSYALEASRNGMPLARPLALELQDDPKSVAAPGDEYLFGRELLVAPVLAEGQLNRRVYYPPGKWIDWEDGYEYEGGREYVVAAPPERIPLAVRAGAILPLAPDMLSTGEKPWDPLTLEIFPSGKSEFTLYQDDGKTFGYRSGEFTTTAIACAESAEAVNLTITESNKRFTPATYQARFHLNAAPTAVTDGGGAKLASDWSPETRVLSVTLPAGTATRHAIRVALDGKRLPPRVAPTIHLTAANVAEASGGNDRPVPQFFPPPAVPARLKAINYDKGGEGVAFHTTRALPAKPRYRPDDFAIEESGAANGDFVLGGLGAGEWMRYTLDRKDGGWFDLTARVASERGGGRLRVLARNQVLATIAVPATGGIDAWRDVTIPNVFLDPGVISLQVAVDKPGFRLHTLEFASAVNPPLPPPEDGGLKGTLGVHDPSTVAMCDGKYYVYGTGRGISVLTSADGLTWERGQPVFDRIPDSVKSYVPKNNGSGVWAPDIVKLNGEYYLYYSISSWGEYISAVGLMTSPTLDPKSPNYKWADRGMIVHSVAGQNLNAIDPGVLHAPDGRLWLCYGSYHGNIELVELDPKTGLRIAPDSKVTIIANKSEASDLIFHDGYYYLMVNHGSCCKGKDSKYHILSGRSKTVTGPYLDRDGVDLAEGGGTLFLKSSATQIGPGHFGMFVDHGVEKFSCHYEADLSRGGRSRLEIRPLRWSADGWPMPGKDLK